MAGRNICLRSKATEGCTGSRDTFGSKRRLCLQRLPHSLHRVHSLHRDPRCSRSVNTGFGVEIYQERGAPRRIVVGSGFEGVRLVVLQASCTLPNLSQGRGCSLPSQADSGRLRVSDDYEYAFYNVLYHQEDARPTSGSVFRIRASVNKIVRRLLWWLPNCRGINLNVG